MISAELLSKQYQLGSGLPSYNTLRESLMQNLARLKGGSGLTGASPGKSQTIWALKDVSFNIEQGQAVGVVGRNGAGKSTLLKILARITRPTSGRAYLRGRVGSLLEVGTGFHPELTGKENIYLNGAILGMRRAEIRRKFDEIIDFAEIERFLDTPVKRYSSGMYMRLAFAVAAHLDPEILLVDEVLAVGDAAFQKKCLGKMGEVAHSGRTILFVSHNMDAIARLCERAIWLQSGRVADYGSSGQVIQAYLSSLTGPSQVQQKNFHPALENRRLVFHSASLKQSSPGTSAHSALRCTLEYEVLEQVLGAVVAVRIDTLTHAPVITLTDNDLDPERFIKQRGRYRAEIELPTQYLAPGIYRLTLSAADMKSTRYDFHEGALEFTITQPGEIQTTFEREGPLLLPVSWGVSRIS